MLAELRRRFALLSPAGRRRWAGMALLGLASAVLEGAAGALVFALVTVVLDRSTGTQGRLVDSVRALLPAGDPGTAVIALAGCAAAIHIAKNVLLVGLAWWRARVVAFDTAALSTRLLCAYVAAPWPFHLRRGSAGLMENIRDSTRPFFEVFESAATLLGEAAVVLALAAVAIVAGPIMITAVCAGIVLVVGAALRITRNAQRRGGARHFELGAALYRHVQHSLGALKEIRILGRGTFFTAAFSRDARESARLDTVRATLDAVPRVLLETMFVAGMLALIVADAGSRDAATVLPLVGLYAYMGFRIIPAAHRIALQVSSIRWGLAATVSLVEDLQQLERLAPREESAGLRLPFRDRLEAERISFTYEGSARPVLTDISLSIRPGESVAITGATGAGKTTLVDILIGLLPPSTGTVSVDGVPIGDRLSGWHQNIGYVPQTPFLLDDTLRRNIALGVPDDQIDDEAVSRAIAAARLQHMIAGLPEGLATTVGERGIRLSGGERQRVSIARALYRDPALVIFDEATSSLDPATERDVAQALDALRGHRTVIVIAHRLTTVERCDRVLLLAGGRIEAAGSYAELASANAAFRALAALG